ncbi:hypothetical protein Tco_1561514 [Tanacetum coccineum]
MEGWLRARIDRLSNLHRHTPVERRGRLRLPPQSHASPKTATPMVQEKKDTTSATSKRVLLLRGSSLNQQQSHAVCVPFNFVEMEGWLRARIDRLSNLHRHTPRLIGAVIFYFRLHGNHMSKELRGGKLLTANDVNFQQLCAWNSIYYA